MVEKMRRLLRDFDDGLVTEFEFFRNVAVAMVTNPPPPPDPHFPAFFDLPGKPMR